MASKRLFPSFFLGGFECSSHRLHTGRRLDLLNGTAHDRHAAADYERLREMELRVARDGVRWHRIESTPGRYDFSSLLPMVRAAREAGVRVIWDLCHYGWPDDLDLFRPEFVHRFAAFAGACARVLASESDEVPWIVPINEISFFGWAAGEVGYIYPFERKRGEELKAQLVRAAIAGIEAIWEVDPRARVIHADPVIHVLPNPDQPDGEAVAAAYCAAQFHAWDMLSGRYAPELGGDPKYLDILGVNYYPHNQWVFRENVGFNPSFAIPRTDPRYRPFREILREVWERYQRPLFLAETGAEGEARPGWLRYIGREVRAAMRAGVPIEGVCLYPIVNHPGWDDDRHCHNGLWDYADEEGEREMYEPLGRELRRQQHLMRRAAQFPA